MNEELNLSRKTDKEGIADRAVILKDLSNQQLLNQIKIYKNEFQELNEISKKLQEIKNIANQKAKNILSKEVEENSDLKLLKSLSLSLDSSKKILNNIKENYIDIYAGYSETLEEETNQDQYKLVYLLVNKLLNNKNKGFNTLTNTFDINIKSEIVGFIDDNKNINLPNLLKKTEEVINNTTGSNNEIFSSTLNLGTILKQNKFNSEGKIVTLNIFKPSEDNTCYREINIESKEHLSTAINNFIKINQIYKKELNEKNKERVIVLLSQSSQILEDIIKQQVISLSKKETELGIKNTILTILVLSSIYLPFFNISRKLYINNRISSFKSDLLRFRDNVQIIKMNFESTFKKLNISDNAPKDDNYLFTKEIKSLYDILDFSYNQKQDFLTLQSNFERLKEDKVKILNYSKKIDALGFNSDNFKYIDKNDLKDLPYFSSIHINNEKRNLSQGSDLLKYFKENIEYVETLNNKIYYVSLIHNLKTHIIEHSSNGAIYLLEILIMIIDTLDKSKISAKTIELIISFIELLEIIKDKIKIYEKTYKTKSQGIDNTEDIKTDLLNLLSNTNDILNEQRIKHGLDSREIEIDTNSNFQDIINIIPSVQDKINFFITNLTKLIKEFESVLNNRLSSSTKKETKIYSAPTLLPVKNQETKQSLNIDSEVDPRTTNLKNINIEEIMKNISFKDKKNTD